ncbi:MAG: FtsQ-type POTRA domain-containing protein [Clostridia bacterium]|nr:FtsQ-type POTRA domain-containing protein [Clostridia bacterium]
MDKNNILQFEADDTSKTGINGKQVFFAKRINGKVTRNKEIEKQSRHIQEKEQNNDEELFIEFKNIKVNPQNIPPQKQESKINRANNKKLKRRRKNIARRIIVLLVLLVGTAVFAMVSPIFNIQKINVIGNEKIDESTIISLSGELEGKNIFQISKKKVINNIKENPYIDSVTIKRNLPGTLQINIDERKTAYQIKVINSYVYINYQGYILEVSSKSADVPIIEGFQTEQDTLLNGKKLSDKDIEALRIILRIMETAKSAEVSKLISKISIQNNEYLLEMKKENKIVYLGNATDLTNRMTYVKIIVDKEKGKTGKVFVNGDINSGFKPYFREENIEK